MVKRRGFLRYGTIAAMAASLAASYGTLAAIMGRFLYPARPPARAWQFVARLADLPVGGTLNYKSPSGETVNVTRRDAAAEVSSFVALSSVCPHLGCQVHWEAQNDRFFCPCHNGVFAPDGTATAGPPAAAKQSLPAYPLKIETGLLYIDVPIDSLKVVAGPPSQGRA